MDISAFGTEPVAHKYVSGKAEINFLFDVAIVSRNFLADTQALVEKNANGTATGLNLLDYAIEVLVRVTKQWDVTDGPKAADVRTTLNIWRMELVLDIFADFMTLVNPKKTTDELNETDSLSSDTTIPAESATTH